MNTFEVAQVMHMAPGFYGVVPCCDIDRFKGVEVVGLIVNTDPHNKPGQHWVGIYKQGRTIHFFDSFGRDFREFAEPFASIMKDFVSDFQVFVNKKQYQDEVADTCGRWTFYYILSRICGISDFSEFSNDTEENEIELSRQLVKIGAMLKHL